MYPIAIIGAGGFAKEVYGLCCDLNRDIYGFFVEQPTEQTTLFDKPISVGIMSSRIFPQTIAIGHSQTRKRIAEQYSIVPVTLMHPSVIHYNYKYIQFGEGCIFCPNVVMTNDIIIGKYVHVNLGATIGHDVTIGDYVTIAPGVHISGKVKIGNGVTIGTGAVILPGINIGDNAIIGAGAVVNYDVNEGITVAGVPARRIK